MRAISSLAAAAIVVDLGAELVFPALVRATPGRMVTVTLTWVLQRCIEVTYPDPDTGRTTTKTGMGCGNNGRTIVSYFAPVGTLYGIDAKVGNNINVSCLVTDANTNEFLVNDLATRGDGRDAAYERAVRSTECFAASGR